MDAKQKKLLEDKIYNLIKEGMFEDVMPETDSVKSDYEKAHDNVDDRKSSRASRERERNVIKWLTDDQENNAAVAAQLWPEMDEDTRRSLFSKKLRGHDSDGKSYHFTAEEVNELWKIKNMFVKKIDESTLVKMIKESIEKQLKKR